MGDLQLFTLSPVRRVGISSFSNICYKDPFKVFEALLTSVPDPGYDWKMVAIWTNFDVKRLLIHWQFFFYFSDINTYISYKDTFFQGNSSGVIRFVLLRFKIGAVRSLYQRYSKAGWHHVWSLVWFQSHLCRLWSHLKICLNTESTFLRHLFIVQGVSV